MKKKLSLLFALMLSTLTANAYGTLIDSIYYQLGFRKNSEGTYKSCAAVTYYSLTSNDSVYYGNIVIPPSVKEDFSYPVTDLGKKAFFNCTRLSSVSIPNSVTSIRDSVFFGCCSLTSITIPNGVTYIGKHAFSGCNNLDSIFVSYEQPSAVDANAFDGISDKAVLYVPYGKKSLYESLEGWNRISTIKEVLIDGSIFTASTPEGVNMKFRVISEENKTAEVYGSYGTMIEVAIPLYRIPAATVNPAISDTVSIGITIPEFVDGYKVVALSDFAFSSCNLLPFISIPESVKIIGISAFSGCSSLTNITIPNSVTSIGRGTFSGCSKLTSIIIPSSVTTIEMHTFSECSNISSISLPLSITKISEESFDYCRSLSTINLPNSLTTIGANAFNGCDNLKSIVIPSSVTSIGMDASNTISNPFENCSSLESIVVETGNTVYDSRNNCNAIIRKIDNELIVGCKNSFIPNSVTSIGNNAFSGCSWLSSVTIPNNVTRIGYSAFSNCASLTSINIPNVCTEICAEAFWGCTNLTFVNIPNECSTIGDDAFSDCHSLLTITFPQHIKSIGARAFADCSSLGNVTSLSTQPITIETNTFENISKDAVLYVPLGSKAKYENIEEWNRFKTIEEILIDGSTFTAHTEEGVELEFTVISTSEKTCKVSDLIDYRTEGKITIPSEVNSFRVIEIGGSAFGKCSGITSVYLPNTVKSIGSLAFGDCSSLSTINLPNSITTIGANAFNGCKSLKSIVIPSSVTSIGEGAAYTTSNPFENCSSLESIVVETGNTVYDSRDNCNAIIRKSTNDAQAYMDYYTLITGCKNTIMPSSVQAIGGYAFAGMDLTHIEIPSNIQYIGDNAFYGNYVEKKEFVCHCALDPANFSYWGCTILDTAKDGYYIVSGELIKYAGSETEITIPATVTSIGNYVFSGYRNISSVTIPNSVTNIGQGAFKDCSNLEYIKVPNSVKNIGAVAFSGCIGLTSVELSDGIKEIGTSAFWGCSSLRDITLPQSLTSIGATAFNGCEKLVSIRIPQNISVIEFGMFRGCSDLQTVTIPLSVKKIGDSAFQGCKNLTEVYCLAFACPEIGNGVFLDSNISNATLWVLETSYEVYKTTAPWLDFGNILTKEVATVNPSNFTFTATTAEGVQMRFRITDSVTNSAEVYGYYVSRTATLKDYYPAISQNVSKVTIPASVITNYGEYNITSISSDAFYNCNVNTLTIPGSIKTIRYDAFKGCTNLNKVIIPDIAAWCSVKFELYNYTSFRNNNPLTIGSLYSDENTEISNLVIPDGVTAINDYAFYYCKNLTSVKIPKSVTSIGKNAFLGCSSLQKVIAADIAAWCSISFASFMDNPISQCHCLYSDDNTEITELTIPENVTHIAPYAFKDCWNIVKFIMPDGLQSIGEDALPFPQKTVGTNITWYNLYYYCNKGTAGLLAIWNYLSQLSKRYDQKVIDFQSAYDLQDRVTKLPAPSLSVNTTQTTATVKVLGIYEGYNYTLNWNPLETDEIKFSGLEPGYSQNMILRVTLPAAYSASYIYETRLSTKELSPSVSIVGAKSATSLSVSGTYNHGDAIVTKETLAICKDMKKGEYADNSAYCSIYNPNATNRSDFYSNYYLVDGTESVEGSKASFHGLDPCTKYYVVYNVYIGSKKYSAVHDDTTEPLNLTTNSAKIISVGNAIVSATTNLDDEETNVGFEWRDINWDEKLFPSNKAKAIPYEGNMEGYIRNINADKLWKFRPYYISDSGTYYYGNWMGLDPTNASYFEPTVRTSSAYTVNETTASVKGYAMRGTDNIVSQGFKYWSLSNSARGIVSQTTAVPASANTVEATENIMTAEFTDLEYETEYHYVAFVTTSENEIFYGEERIFVTGKKPALRGDVNGDGFVNGTDIQTVINAIVDDEYDENADVNEDGKVNGTDIQEVINIIVNAE